MNWRELVIKHMPNAGPEILEGFPEDDSDIEELRQMSNSLVS